MTRRPIIGITSYPPGETHGFHIPGYYVESVLRAGGVPVILPCAGKETIPEWLSMVDGVILSGGGDLNPIHYSGTTHDTIYNLNPARDETELRFAEALLDSNLPFFCICRGLQVLNVVLGGTLYPHLPDHFGDSVLHRAPPREPILHEVSISEDSRLFEILGEKKIQSLSWHHQAIREPGRGVRPVATAPDGVIEAIEIEGQPRILAVQWHPELNSSEDPLQQKLFDRFLRLSGKED